jgi:flagellar hook-length control protein FliK
MATPVPGGSLDFTASSTAATASSADSIRNGGDGALDASFSSLLRGQLRGGANTGALTFSTFSRSAANPGATNSGPARPSSAPREPLREPAPNRDMQRAGKDEHAAATGHGTRDAAAPPEAAAASATDRAENSSRETPQTPEIDASANAGTDATDVDTDADAGIDAAPDESQPPAASAAGIAPELAATIAALLGGIAAGTNTNNGESADAAVASGIGAKGGLITADGAAAAGTAIANGAAGDDAMESEADARDSAHNAFAAYSRKLSTTAGASAPDPGTAGAAGGKGGGQAFSSHTASAAAAGPAVNIAALTQRADVLVARAGAQSATATLAATPDAAAAPLLNALRTPAQASAAASQFSIPVGAGQRAWAEEVGNRVMWMLGRAESRAELVLTPPHLGKVEVSINLNGDQTTAQFMASSQAARDALEQAMPRLRELLSQAGINLGDASVGTSAEGKAQDGGEARGGEHAAARGAGDGDGGDGSGEAPAAIVSNWVKLDSGRINTFA